MNTLLVVMLVCLAALGALSLHKLRRVHLMLFAMRDQGRHDADNLYRQLEALAGLYIELDLKKGLPATRGWAASPDFLMALTRHALTHKPATVVECSSGTSTVVLARCMQLNGGGKVYSLEHDADYARQTVAQLDRLGLSDYAQVLHAPIKLNTAGGKSWPWYDAEQLPAGLAIDMLVVDGPPEATAPLARFPAGPVLFGQVAPGGAVFLDDAARPDETSTVAQWLAQFPAFSLTELHCEKGCARLTRGAA